MHNLKILGYQGNYGSNNENASNHFIMINQLKNISKKPLITPSNVIKELKNNEIDYGVIAYNNSIGGFVEDSKKLLFENEIDIISSISLPINHSLFKTSPKIDNKTINLIKSHPQALKQCSIYLNTMFKDAKQIPVEDTASAAINLKENNYFENTAIICSTKTGLRNGLTLIQSNIQNRLPNITTFYLIKNKPR